MKARRYTTDALHMTHAHARRGAFSLIELVVVVAVIAIIAAIAVRRLSRHAEQAGATGLAADLNVLQLAIDRYRAEHTGLLPTQGEIEDQLTKYTDANGGVSATMAPPHVYGPYVRKIPPVPTGPAIGRTKIGPAPAADVGWIYTASTGEIAVNDTGP
jgi:prepilin-type N-terminal cleavage/methylation domain-containing protein